MRGSVCVGGCAWVGVRGCVHGRCVYLRSQKGPYGLHSEVTFHLAVHSYVVVLTDVRRGASGTSRDVPIFVQFHKKNQNLYTLVVKKQNSYTLVVKNPKFVHFGSKKPKIRILW